MLESKESNRDEFSGRTGYGWRGKSYASLSEVARAITGTRWSGPRFFGLQA